MHLRPALASAVLACLVASASPAHAEPPRANAPAAAPAAASSVSAEDRARAEERFKTARALYLEGRYVEARTSLLEARKLDPSAKDLVFNLGIVAEKLLDYDDAITYLREYKAMDTVTEAEAQRADTSIRRIEGARALHPKSTQSIQTAPTSQPPTPRQPEPVKRGRLDALTLGGLGVTGAALATGVVFGVLALSSNPASTVTTGDTNPYAQVDRDNSRAQTFGLVADIGFGVAVVGAVTTAVLYFARPAAEPKNRVGLVAAPGGWKVRF